MLAPPEKKNPAMDGNPGEVIGNNNRSSAYSNPEADVKTFTSKKLDWLTHVSADALIKSVEFETAFVIAQHVNAITGKAYLSDEVIAEYVRADQRTLRRVRKALRDRGWISWTRTGIANAYSMLFTNIADVADDIAQRRIDRVERRNERLRDRTTVSGPRKDDRTSVTADRTLVSADRTTVTADRTPVPAIHLSLTPSHTPSNTPQLFEEAAPTHSDGRTSIDKKASGTGGRKRKRSIKSELPDDWVLSDSQWNFGAKLGLTADEIEVAQRKLKRWVKREGKRYVDWNSFIEEWLEREIAFLRKSVRPGSGDSIAGYEDFLEGTVR